MNYSHIFIDADDTIFDYMRAERHSLEKTLLRFGIDCDIEKAVSVYRVVNDRLWKEFEKGAITLDYLRSERFRQLLSSCGRENADEAECLEVSRAYLDELSSSGFLIEGAREMLEKLSGRCSLIMITNGISSVQRKRLEVSDTAKYFSGIVISEEIGCKKPQKDYFDIAFRKAGDPVRGTSLVVGDSLSSDILGGINYGIDTCWFNPHGKENIAGIEPKYEVSSHDEICGIILSGIGTDT